MAKAKREEQQPEATAAEEAPQQTEQPVGVAAYATPAREFTKSLNIWQKIAYVMANAHRVPKTGYNDHFKYHYVTEADITDHLRPLMAEAGLVLLSTLVSDEQVEAARNQTLFTLSVDYTIVDADTGEKHNWLLKAQGLDGQDKGYYKAYTGGNKYALLKLFQISTGDDPEADSNQREGMHQQRQQPRRERQDPPPQQRQRDPAGGNPTPAQQAARDRARAEQAKAREAAEAAAAPAEERAADGMSPQPQGELATAELRAELEALARDERVPEDKRKATLGYLARHMDDLLEANAKTMIARLQTFLPPSEGAE